MKVVCYLLCCTCLCAVPLIASAQDIAMKYASCGRMRYEACPKPLLLDQREYYCFLHHDQTTGFNTRIGRNNCWQVEADTFRRYLDDTVLSGNEYPGAWGTNRPGPMRIGICLQVTDVAACADSDRDVVTGVD